jgi:mannose/fructose-specific phosphotransferase system component IIA
MIAGILIGHGELPIVLNRTIQKIIGEQDNFLVISNDNCSAAELHNRLNTAVTGLDKKDVIIFVDLFGGSCANVSNQLLKNPSKQKIGIICGVNPAMLIKYFQYRGQKSFTELLQLLEETGKNEIRVTTSK